ncbi:glycosyltransferase family 4 protein [Portibacter lacus]|uniref:1,2-diacylglycerol 3-glucosyltransferase n=1 Tax=Portibacter lacus TaxID=1099794 RepID=A0AA37WEM6_9BACT|nr:glycosyltransferase family 4 protein [Portibacter lacus]GLR17577.1 1,2-diacylglycerol 3-glucosyltransferase [Portibacter lacus]
MKVLVLNFEYPPLGGGASPVCRNICLELQGSGHELTVVTMGFEGLAGEEIDSGIKIHRISVGRKEPNMSYPLEHLRFLQKGKQFLKKHLVTHNYEVIHCHFIISTGILADWVFRKYRIPFIITAHGSDLPGFNPDRFKLMHFVTPFFIRRVLKNCIFIVSPSHYLEQLITPFLEKSEKLKMIPNGIELQPIHMEKKRNIILSTGRLLARKGFATLVKAVQDLESDFTVHICGDGPQREELEKLALNSKTKIVFHGWLDNTSDAYQNLLKQTKIYCLVSKFENASIAILEAMAHGCAVITSNKGGTAEMVAESGVLISPDDPVLLKEVLLRLIHDDKQIKELGSKAIERVKEKYTWQSIGNAYEQVLMRSVNSNTNSI